ncbi:MAG: DUF2807 domain-containing protein [Bacteroidales bacterium]|nr:DUF2807 domain-containing protein [Bacteroidales bacterium]
MRAKRVLVVGFLLLGLIFTMSCVNGVVGNGDVEVKTETIDSFDRLDISGNFKVFLRQGSKPGLKIEADENLQEYITVHQIGNKLEIGCDRNIIRAKKKDLHITFTDLGKLNIIGAADIEGETPVEVESLAVFCSGAMDLNMDLIADRLRIDVSGAVNCDLKGRVKEVSLVLSGAGDFNALDMRAENMDIELTGAGRVRVFVTEKLDAEISGAGSIRYKGDPEIRKDISGIGSLREY